MKFSHVVVDGSNIATEGRDLPSLQQLDEAVTGFLDEHDVDNLTVVVDATFGHRIQPEERQLYEDAITAHEIITPPAGVVGRGDTFVLQVADRAAATVLSNDSFQEFHGTYEWLFEDNRLIGGKPIPGLGWVFVPRVPVRGAISRKAVQDAKKARRSGEPVPLPGGERDRERKRDRRRGGKDRDEGKPSDTKDRTGRTNEPKGRGGKGRDAKVSDGRARDGAKGGGRDRATTPALKAASPGQHINEPLPFIEFVGAHPVGSLLEGEVEKFTSHGAYVLAGGARCYVPLKTLGSPAPKSAREVLDLGAVYEFRVEAIDTPRRGIDVTLVGIVSAGAKPDDSAKPERTKPERTKPERTRTERTRTGRTTADHVTADDATADDATVDAAATTAAPARPRGRTSTTKKAVPTKRPTARKAAANEGTRPTTETRAARTARTSRVAPSRTSAHDDAATSDENTDALPVVAVATEATTRSTRTAKAAIGTRSTDTKDGADHTAEEAQVTPVKKAAKKAAGKKAAAKKAPAKKAAAKKAAKKAPAKKAAAKKAVKKAAKKAPAKKAPAKKAAAKKAAKKAPAKKAAKKAVKKAAKKR